MPTRPPGTPDVDLTFDGGSGSVNGAVFMTGTFQSTPGQLSSFLEIRNNGTEQGYNTDGTLQQDQRDVQNSTHSILLAEVPIVIGDGSNGTVEGVAYREFRLNLGEAGNAKQYLSLDALQIWQEESGSLTNFTSGSGFAGAHTNYLAYNLDAGGDHWIGLKEGANGNGADQTEFTILIPDADFINDPSHRYITLYSKFGMQSGWEADSSSEVWGLSHASGGPVSAMTVHKTATVPGGTADHVGEVISYGITVANVGNTSLTGITVTDPSVSNLAPVLSGGFNSGDTNHDNQLSAGETWNYTASHTVTQNDINTLGGGDGFIDNTVTADSAQTTPVSATASVVVESGASVDLVKTADVTSVNAVGTVVHYTINVTNTGNTTLTNPVVEDSNVNIVTPIYDLNAPILGPALLAPVLNGDYNVGDVGTPGHPEFAQDGIQEPGETFQFKNAGDENNNGVEDNGETFLFTNVGDTNQNGNQDTGETFQYYNAGDTNHDGDQESGETFQFQVSHAATPVDANNDTLNDGDTNNNGALDVGETWHYTVAYTVTQDDIDNGGVVNPALTHDNTATVTTSEGAGDSGSASVLVVQNPHVTLVKSASVPGGTADAAGEVIAYTINVTNDGNMTLTSPVVSDPSVSNLAAVLSGGFNSGDADQDGKIDVGETWHYTANHTVTQAEMDAGGTISNTASVTTAQGAADADANDSDTASVTIVQNPQVVLDKTATVPGGTADTVGEVISYAITIHNTGNVTLTNPVVSDASVTDLAPVVSGGFNAGDLDHDGKLDVGETWQYSASHTVTATDLSTNGGGDGTIDNTASVTTDQGATSNDSASVTVVQPAVTHGLTLVKSAFGFIDNNNDDVANTGDTLVYHFAVHSTGTGAETNVQVNDVDGNVTVTGGVLASLAPGATDSTTWAGTYAITSLDVSAGYHDNTAVANSDFSNASSGTVHTILAMLNELP